MMSASHVCAAQSRYRDLVAEAAHGRLGDQARPSPTTASAGTQPRPSPFGRVRSAAHRALVGVAMVAVVLAIR
jgi:hypothetical protein